MSGNGTQSPWPRVPLGELLCRSEEAVSLQVERTYKEVTVRLWGRGVALRGERLGGEIAGKTRNVVRRRQFVFSRIDARNGAFGLVPDELDGAVVSSDFPAFNPDEDRLLPEFLELYAKRRSFAEEARRVSKGTTNRVRLREDGFYRLTIPLPQLPEQRRIVAKVQSLATKIDEAQELRDQSDTRVAALRAAAEMRLWPDACLANAPTLEDVTTVLSRGRQSEQGESQHYLIKTQHVQMARYRKTDLRLSDRAAARVRDDLLVQKGDILIACSAAGCLGRVAWCDESRTASCDTHVAIARPDLSVVLPEYLYVYLRGAQGQYQLRNREKGDWQREKIGFRLTELNVNDMRRVPVFVPDMETQRQLISASDALHRRINDLNSRAADTERMLDAFPPSILDSAFKGEL